jgi:hypothetical protein
MGVRPAHVEIVIDEIVLIGFPAADRRRIAAGIAAELEGLAAAADQWQARDVVRVDGGSFPMAPLDRPETIGARIAARVTAGLQP